MVYIDNLDGYEEVYDELEEIPTTTDFIYYDAGKLARFIFCFNLLCLIFDGCFKNIFRGKSK